MWISHTVCDPDRILAVSTGFVLRSMSLSVSQALCFFGNYEIFVFLVCQWISLRWSLHHLLCLSCSESATLDLVAVLGRVEVLHHLLVLLRHEGLSKPENGNPIRKLSRWKKIDTGDSCGSLLSSKLGGNVVRGSGGRPMGWCRPFINTVRRKTIVIHSDWTRNLIGWSWVLTFNTERVQEEENKTEINRQGVVALSEVGKKCRRRWKEFGSIASFSKRGWLQCKNNCYYNYAK